MKKILIVDDAAAVTNYLMVVLMQTDLFEPVVVNDSREVAGILEQEQIDAVLLDMDMPNVSGTEILRGMRDKGMDTPVVVLTGVSDVDLAVNAMKLGAFDYLIKPVDDEKLVNVLQNALKHGVLHRTIDQLPPELTRKDLAHASAFEHLPTLDPSMIRLFHQAENVASSDLSIFIWGESGTGKEALARAIHQASPRRERPFLAVEADSEDPEHFPSFFFGQGRDWSGSREEAPGLLKAANHGTLFLNNIDALQPPMQVRLRRFIQIGEYYRENSTQIRNADVRMIVSSTKDLTSPDYEERFSRDLLYHLMINSIRIPSLHERAGDIPLLATHFLEEEAGRLGKTIEGFSGECIEFLKGYSFPNNVMELRTIIAGAVAKEESGTVTLDSLPAYIKEVKEPEIAAPRPTFTPRKLDDVIREHVLRTIEHFGRDRDRAAEELDIPRSDVDRIAGTEE